MTTDIAVRRNGIWDNENIEILGHLGRAFTVAYLRKPYNCPDNTWTALR
jgi:hypothetical protein